MADLRNPGSVFGDSTKLSFSSNTFTKKEMVMAVAGLVALVFCLVFVGLYGAKVSSNGGSTNAIPTAAPLRTDMCKSVVCLETTASVASYMNRSVQPCEDFHTYACGVWPQKNPIVDGFVGNTPITSIYNKNKEKLRRLLEDPITDSDISSEKKLKKLFKSCLDDYGKMIKGANPFLTKVLNPAGGWTVLNNMDDNWDLQTALEKVHVDFWVDALFGLYVGVDWNNRANRVVVNVTYVSTHTKTVLHLKVAFSSCSTVETKAQNHGEIMQMGAFMCAIKFGIEIYAIVIQTDKVYSHRNLCGKYSIKHFTNSVV